MTPVWYVLAGATVRRIRAASRQQAVAQAHEQEAAMNATQYREAMAQVGIRQLREQIAALLPYWQHAGDTITREGNIMEHTRANGYLTVTECLEMGVRQRIIDQIGDAKANAYYLHATPGGAAYAEWHEHGSLQYVFTDAEMADRPEEDYPWDNDHIASVWDRDGNMMWPDDWGRSPGYTTGRED